MTTERTITIDDDVYQVIKKTAMKLEMIFHSETDVLRVLLGIDSGEYLSYVEAVTALHDLKIPSPAEYTRLHIDGQLPEGLPINPKTVYEYQGWRSWGYFLGNNIGSQFLSFEEARTKVAELIPDDFSLRTHAGWLKWCRTGKRPYGVPSNPDKVYHLGWKGWNHFMSADDS